MTELRIGRMIHNTALVSDRSLGLVFSHFSGADRELVVDKQYHSRSHIRDCKT